MKMYKIRDIKTGLFSSGGMYPSWSKNGKIWSTLGKMSSHLKYFDENKVLFWEAVEYDAIESGTFAVRELTKRKVRNQKK